MMELSCYKMWQSGSIIVDHQLSASALSTMMHHLCDAKSQILSAFNSRSISIFFQPQINLSVCKKQAAGQICEFSLHRALLLHHARLTHLPSVTDRARDNITSDDAELINIHLLHCWAQRVTTFVWCLCVFVGYERDSSDGK